MEEEIQEITPQEEVQEPVEEAAPQEEENAGFQQFTEHIRGLEAQAAEMQKDFPDFDLRQALQDPVFLQLTAPGTGISVEDAYYALHRRQIMDTSARQTREKVVQAIQSGSRRPLEAGTDSQAPSMTTFHYSSASREQRDAFKKELRRAWGRGEQVYPGDR